ncbi:MAG: hypothetical protein IKQ87_10670 [Clostridia bacterium]|nr:hypothetical protein [Clostridia bacterium]
MKRTLAILLAMLLLFASCANGSGPESSGDGAGEGTPTDPSAAAETVPETEEPALPEPDLPADLKFDGATFTFGVVDNPNAKNAIVMEEVTGEVLNDAQYDAINLVNEALGVTVQEYVMTSGYPALNSLTPIIAAGDDAIQVANVFCVDATGLLSGGYVLGYENIPYIDLSKPWWDQGANESLTLAGIRYAAIGDLSISTHDLTYVLLFSSALIDQNSLENPYSLVFEGKWTMDKMKSMCEAVLLDANGNGTRDEEDVYGYLSAVKMVLPSFWIGAGVKSMEFDETGTPVLTMADEKFNSVFEKIYAMTYDNDAWIKVSEDSDVPLENRTRFSTNHSLFLDCSLFWVAALREMETDFGIIPYPKYDENQQNYCSRISYYMPPMIPKTNQNLELVGAVLEEANYQAKKLITPAYYDIALKGKYARDKESIQMLDLIFDSRVIDLGDTLFCSQVRDGFVASMFSSNNRDLASTVAKNVKVINKQIQKMIEAINGN